ncbi:hypothetical protein FOZ60_008528 [Perkinsus olseni]|uniref:Uncharacterized protein n=1 Tax=Perkinsus olseni TaxID=32597 RepID=A0A7J6NJL0_PEROL|nr:hypothetical protein FOZ60_008528 [Perkinsus olseni]
MWTLALLGISLVSAFSRPGGQYYNLIDYDDELCVQITWPSSDLDEPRPTVTCSGSDFSSDEYSVFERKPNFYEASLGADEFLADLNENCQCCEMKDGDLSTFLYNNKTNTMVTYFSGQAVTLESGNCDNP